MAVALSPQENDGTLSTRDHILQEALRCFAQSGFEGTSLNEIAAAVGIRRPSVLHHFPSKDALYEDVFEKLLSDWLERLDDAIASTASGWEKFELVVRAGFELFEENPDYVRIMRREALDGGVHLGIDLSAVVKPLFDSAVQYLDQAMKQGTFQYHDPQHLLITGYGAILTYFSDAPFIDGLLSERVLSREAVSDHCDAVITFFHAALVGERSLP
jgi:TetR/AcrR family transcriptional regulator